MAGIKDYSLTAASNTAINSISVAEGCAPSGINDAIRQEMADTRGFYECGGWIDLGLTHTYSSGTAVTVASDVTASYPAGRRIKAVGSGTGTIYGVVASSSYGAPNTTINFTWDSGSLTNESLTVSAGWVVPTGYPINSTAIKGSAAGNMINTGTPTAGQIPKYSDTSGTAIAPGYTVDTDTTLAANSDSNVATQKATKAYVDTATASAGKPAFKNLLIGGSALTNPWQLGTSVAVSGTTLTYGPDRWFGKGGAAGSAYTMSQQASSVTASPYCFRVQRTASNTDTSVITFGQVVETINAKSLQGKTVTLSFQARSGANFSAASSYLVSTISTGTGADQGSSSLIAGTWTGQANTAQNNTLTTSFQTFTQTITVPSTATELAVRLSYTPVGTAGAADYFDVLDVQLEVGSSASTFEVLPEDVVLARCQRYYSKTYDQGVSPGAVNLNSAITALSVGTAVNSVNLFWQYPVRMRASPTVTIYSPNTGATGQMRRNAGAADVAAVPYNQGSCAVTAYNNATITSGDMHWAHMTASAEL